MSDRVLNRPLHVKTSLLNDSLCLSMKKVAKCNLDKSAKFFTDFILPAFFLNTLPVRDIGECIAYLKNNTI